MTFSQLLSTAVAGVLKAYRFLSGSLATPLHSLVSLDLAEVVTIKLIQVQVLIASTTWVCLSLTSRDFLD